MRLTSFYLALRPGLGGTSGELRMVNSMSARNIGQHAGHDSVVSSERQCRYLLS